MFVSYGLYVWIILEIAHHRTTLEYFAILLKILHLKKIARKMFHISFTICTFLSYGKVKDIFLEDKDQISSGEGKSIE